MNVCIDIASSVLSLISVEAGSGVVSFWDVTVVFMRTVKDPVVVLERFF